MIDRLKRCLELQSAAEDATRRGDYSAAEKLYARLLNWERVSETHYHRKKADDPS